MLFLKFHHPLRFLRCQHLLFFPLTFLIIPWVFPLIGPSDWLSLNKTKSFFFFSFPSVLSLWVTHAKSIACSLQMIHKESSPSDFFLSLTNRKIPAITLCLCGCLQVILKVNLSKTKFLLFYYPHFFFLHYSDIILLVTDIIQCHFSLRCLPMFFHPGYGIFQMLF